MKGECLLEGAAYLGGVVVVDDAARAQQALGPVYRLLGLPLDVARIGSVAGEVEGITPEAFAGVLCEEFGRRYELEAFEPSDGILRAAAELAPKHAVEVRPSSCASSGGDGRALV